MGLLEGKVALITGGASGLGRAIAKKYIEEGAKVGIIDHSKSKLEEIANEIGDSSNLLPFFGDVRSTVYYQQCVNTLVDQFGKLDIFVGNAGVYDGNKLLKDLSDDQLIKAFNDVFQINVLGYLNGAKATYPELLKTKGCMIFSASYASFHPAGGGALYTASKHAVAGIIKQLAFEYAPEVRVNGVAPGVIDTNMGMPSSLGEHVDSIIEGVEKNIPLQFIPKPDDYAGLYVALASGNISKTMTGTIIQADTGIEIRGLTKVSANINT